MSASVTITFQTPKSRYDLAFVLRNFQTRNLGGFQTVEVLCHQYCPDLNPYRTGFDAPDRA
jgi:hypothetical protein